MSSHKHCIWKNVKCRKMFWHVNASKSERKYKFSPPTIGNGSTFDEWVFLFGLSTGVQSIRLKLASAFQLSSSWVDSESYEALGTSYLTEGPWILQGKNHATRQWRGKISFYTIVGESGSLFSVYLKTSIVAASLLKPLDNMLLTATPPCLICKVSSMLTIVWERYKK